MLKIKNVTLSSKVILAPLSGITDLAFRTVSREYGCKFAFYEMLDASGLIHAHNRTLKMLKTTTDDQPIGAQILGGDPEQVLEAANIILANSSPVLIDLNFACPAKKVLKKKCGAYLLKEPQRCGKIIKKLASSLPVPVTVKLRQGYKKDDYQEGITAAKVAQENGAAAIFFHGRTAPQGYSGKVNYEVIAEAKKALKIPVFGSGDILSANLAKKMLDETGCDGILVARGAMGNPWIFSQIEDYLKNTNIPIKDPSYEEVVSLAKHHLGIYESFKGKDIVNRYYIGHVRKIAMWYTKHLPYAKRAREAITKEKSYDNIMGLIDRLWRFRAAKKNLI